MDRLDLAQNRDGWAGFFKNRNELSGSIKKDEFLD